MSDETVLKIGGDRHGARFGSKRRLAAAGDFDGDGVPGSSSGYTGVARGRDIRGGGLGDSRCYITAAVLMSGAEVCAVDETTGANVPLSVSGLISRRC